MRFSSPELIFGRFSDFHHDPMDDFWKVSTSPKLVTLRLDFVGTQAAKAPLQDGLRRCCVCGAAFATPLGPRRMAQFPESKFTFQIPSILLEVVSNIC